MYTVLKIWSLSQDFICKYCNSPVKLLEPQYSCCIAALTSGCIDDISWSNQRPMGYVADLISILKTNIQYFIWLKLYFFNLRMLCDKCGWTWPNGFWKEIEKWTVHRWKHGQTDDGQKTSSGQEKSHFSF